MQSAQIPSPWRSPYRCPVSKKKFEVGESLEPFSVGRGNGVSLRAIAQEKDK